MLRTVDLKYKSIEPQNKAKHEARQRCRRIRNEMLNCETAIRVFDSRDPFEHKVFGYMYEMFDREKMNIQSPVWTNMNHKCAHKCGDQCSRLVVIHDDSGRGQISYKCRSSCDERGRKCCTVYFTVFLSE